MALSSSVSLGVFGCCFFFCLFFLPFPCSVLPLHLAILLMFLYINPLCFIFILPRIVLFYVAYFPLVFALLVMCPCFLNCSSPVKAKLQLPGAETRKHNLRFLGRGRRLIGF